MKLEPPLHTTRGIPRDPYHCSGGFGTSTLLEKHYQPLSLTTMYFVYAKNRAKKRQEMLLSDWKALTDKWLVFN